jgi:serine/threonine protein kinase
MATFRQIIYVLASIADALTYAHKLGILHQDVKLCNILLDANNKPTDFGLARMMQARHSTLRQDMLVGLHYMSPEQAKGNQELGPGTDIYALGVMYGRQGYSTRRSARHAYDAAAADLCGERQSRP